MEEPREGISRIVANAVTGRPRPFKVGGEVLCLHPTTLGMMHLQQGLLEAMGLGRDGLARWPEQELVLVAGRKRRECCAFIAYQTCRTKEEAFDTALMERRRRLLEEHADDADIATLLLAILSCDGTERLLHHFGIDREQERMRRVMEVKARGDKNSVSFGGLSVFGSLIDAACERYGWTKEYVVWGIDYTSLRLMMADKVSSVYVSDEERKRIPASLLTSGSDAVKGTKENMERIKAMGWH